MEGAIPWYCKEMRNGDDRDTGRRKGTRTSQNQSGGLFMSFPEKAELRHLTVRAAALFMSAGAS